MATLKIKIYGESCLREKCQPVKNFDAQLEELTSQMAETMYEAPGIGLAAPQIGVTQRIFVTDTIWTEIQETEAENGEEEQSSIDENPRKYRVYINPEIVWESDEDESMSEGCLSLPGIEGEVYRSCYITLRYQNLKGETQEEKLEEMEARCCQHELDHLDGVLFIDRMPFAKRSLLAVKLSALKRGELPENADT